MSDRHHRDGGFTIMEMIVSLALVVLLLVLLAPSIRLGQRAWEFGAQIEQRGATPVALHFLEQRLTDARVVLVAMEDGSITGSFSGDRERLRFVAPQPPASAQGGLHSYELALAEDGGGRRLVLTTTLWSTGGVSADRREISLVDKVGGFGIRYFGRSAPAEAPIWQDGWQTEDSLPQLVEVTVTTGLGADASEHRIVIPLRAR